MKTFKLSLHKPTSSTHVCSSNGYFVRSSLQETGNILPGLQLVSPLGWTTTGLGKKEGRGN